LLDGDGNTHNVVFNKSVGRPLLTDGWSELRLFYQFSGSKIIAFPYLGRSRFQIFVFTHNITLADYPPYHSMSTAPSCYCTFEVPFVGYGSTISPKVVYCFFVAIELDICYNKGFLYVINNFFFFFFRDYLILLANSLE
jgi:hypothetical protein